MYWIVFLTFIMIELAKQYYEIFFFEEFWLDILCRTIHLIALLLLSLYLYVSADNFCKILSLYTLYRFVAMLTELIFDILIKMKEKKEEKNKEK